MGLEVTRGVRTNNPGNIRRGKDKWQGMVPEAERQDSEFVEFITPQYGIRALARLLMNYEKKGYNTVRSIINRWAPPQGDSNGQLEGGQYTQDTGSYIKHVSTLLGVDPDDALDVDSYDVMLPLVKAIIAHENNNYAYKDKLVIDAIRMAGVHDAPKKKVTEQGGFKTQIVATTASGLGVVAAAAEPVKKAAEGLDPFTGSPIIAQIVIGLLTVAGGATLAGVIGTWLKARKGL